MLIQRHSVLALGAAHLRSPLSKEPKRHEPEASLRWRSPRFASRHGWGGMRPGSGQIVAVLRNHEVGNCWIATLVRLDSQYTNTFERKAGGPYDTEEQALARLKS